MYIYIYILILEMNLIVTVFNIKFQIYMFEPLHNLYV